MIPPLSTDYLLAREEGRDPVLRYLRSLRDLAWEREAVVKVSFDWPMLRPLGRMEREGHA